MLYYVLFYFLNHDFQRIERLPGRVVMKIKLLVLNFSLEVAFVKLSYVSI
jgi:hypothetical protein